MDYILRFYLQYVRKRKERFEMDIQSTHEADLMSLKWMETRTTVVYKACKFFPEG